MRRRSKYNFQASRHTPGNSRSWVIALILLLAFAGWLAWKLTHPKHPSAPPKVTQPPAVGRMASTARRPAPGAAPQPLPIPHPAISTPPLTPAPATPDDNWPRSVRNIYEAQVALMAHGISSGSLDGVSGSQTRAALAAFQLQEHLPPTGELDARTREQLVLAESPYATCTIGSNELARLQPVATTWLGKSQQTALDFENLLELVAEENFAHPNFIQRLNPGFNWSNAVAGAAVRVPNAAYPEPSAKAAFIRIHLSAKTLEAFDAETNLLAHFPCSIASRVEKRPVGELHVTVAIPNPNYTFDPDVFPESPEAQQLKRKLIIPPGPNNPVGVAWIGLDKPGYGIHGTPRPEDVGRTESHGCFRLANWNAAYLLRLVTIGLPVYVLP